MAGVPTIESIERAVATAVPDPLATVKSSEIGPMFGAGVYWFARASVRERLYAEGFPRPIRPSTYLKRAVVRFMVCRSEGIDPRNGGQERQRPAATINEAFQRAAERRHRERIERRPKR